MVTAVLRVALTQGYFTLVDENDLPWVSRGTWHAVVVPRRSQEPLVYARGGFKRRLGYLHRHIIGVLDDPAVRVDHINGDTLDNRRSNLRIATHAENLRNRGKPGNNKSGYKGVCYDKNRNKWHSCISYRGRQINLGRFDTPEAAARAYDEAALIYHGDFAKLNFAKA